MTGINNGRKLGLVCDFSLYVFEVILKMWQVIAHPEFEAELSALPARVQRDIFAAASLLERYGPSLGRPHADTLKGSRVPNLKELRCAIAGEPWRVAYAFDAARQGILLVAGCKAGVTSDRFYKRLIRTAEIRLDDHMKRGAGR